MADWIDVLANTEQLRETRAEVRAAEAIAASVRIRAYAPEYVRQLEMELREVARKLAEKPSLHVFASLTNDSEPEIETRLHMQVLRHAQWPEITYTDVFWLAGQNVLRCHTAEGAAYKLYFAARSGVDAIGVYAVNGSGTVMTPAQAARYIVEPMIQLVCSGTN